MESMDSKQDTSEFYRYIFKVQKIQEKITYGKLYRGTKVWDKGKKWGKGSEKGRSGGAGREGVGQGEGGAGEEWAGITWIIVILVDLLVLSLTPRCLH